MALFTKSTKTRVSSIDGTTTIETFTAKLVEGATKALTITLAGSDQKTYAITIYGEELKQLKYTLSKYNDKICICEPPVPQATLSDTCQTCHKSLIFK